MRELKTIQYEDDTAKIYAMFYIDIDDPNKTQYINCLMNLILDKNKKDNIIKLYHLITI